MLTLFNTLCIFINNGLCHTIFDRVHYIKYDILDRILLRASHDVS